MSKSSFEEQIMQGAYALGRQRDQLASEKRRLARQLRYAQHSARLTSLSKQYDFGMVFFAAMEPFRSSCSTQTAAPKHG